MVIFGEKCQVDDVTLGEESRIHFWFSVSGRA